MPDLKERPSLELILDAQRYLTEVWSSTHQKWAVRDTFYDRSYKVWKTAAQRKTRGDFRPGRPTAIIDHAADAALQFVATFKRLPVGETDAHKTSADNVEKGLAAVVIGSSMREMSTTWKQIGRYGLHLGYFMVDGPVWSEKDKPVEPKRADFDSEEDYKTRVAVYKVERRFWNPIRIRATHPARVLMDPEDKMPEMAVKLGRMRNYKILKLSQDKSVGPKARKKAKVFDMDNKTPWGESDTIDFWTADWHTFMAAGEILYTEVNMGGFVPFAHAFAGFGMEPTELSQASPEHQAVGLLNPVMDDIVMEAQRMNAMHELMIRRAFANVGTKGDTFELMQQLAEAGIIRGDKDDFFLLPTPDAEGWMFRAGQDTSDDIELSTYAKPISGGKEPGVVTVGQQRILSNAAARKFAAPAMENEELVSITGSRVLRLVDVGGDIGANGVVLRRSDIFHSFNIEAHFDLLDPAAQAERIQEGRQLVNDKIIGWEDFHEDYLGTQDLSKVREHLWEDVVRNHPGVAAQFAQEAAERIGLAKQFKRAVEEEAAALTDGGTIPGEAEMDASSLSPQGGSFVEPPGRAN